MLSAILFDLDETLLDRTTSLKAFLAYQYDRFSRYLGEVDLKEWQDEFLALDGRGLVRKTVVYPAILSKFGGQAKMHSVLYDDYCERCSSFAVPFSGMAETLREIRSQKLKIGLVTNGDTDFQMRHIRALQLEAFADEILISQQEGLRKPDKAIFIRASERLKVSTVDCLFVGDNPVADILGAAAVGMRTAWFRGKVEWPSDQPANPGATIEHLREVLALLDEFRKQRAR